jgi:hypothetical protein
MSWSEIVAWLHQNWFQLVQTVGIISSLVYAGRNLRVTLRAQQVDNLFRLTNAQRELYSRLFDKEELRRVFDSDVNLDQNPITYEERLFLTQAILHFSLAKRASDHDAVLPMDGLERDAKSFFNLPLTKKVWNEIKAVQNSDLVEMVDDLIESQSDPSDHEDSAGDGDHDRSTSKENTVEEREPT